MWMSHYHRESDIASLTLGPAGAKRRAEETEWGLLEYDAETGELVGAEVWTASTTLPRELLDALPAPVGPEVVVERQPA